MTAATEEFYIQTYLPSIEAVRLTISDGYTYTSKKFAKITGVVMGVNEDTDLDINATNSNGTSPIDGTDKTIAFHLSTGSAITTTVILFGFK